MDKIKTFLDYCNDVLFEMLTPEKYLSLIAAFIGTKFSIDRKLSQQHA